MSEWQAFLDHVDVINAKQFQVYENARSHWPWSDSHPILDSREENINYLVIVGPFVPVIDGDKLRTNSKKQMITYHTHSQFPLYSMKCSLMA